MPKILIGIPYHKRKRYSINQLLDWIEQAELLGAEVLMRFHTGIYGEKNAVKTQREFFRKHALENGYDYLYFLGADTIPPLDILPRLLAHNKDVVGGIYYGRQCAENREPDTAVAWKHGESNKKEDLEKQKDLIEIDGMGMDCVLFSREALEKVSWLSWEQNDDDYPYYDKLKEQGFKIYLDTSIVCEHYPDPINKRINA